MAVEESVEKYRLFYASNPSGALCAAICAAIEPEERTIDILLLQSDFYTGDSLNEYEIVMQALASGYGWDKVSFCNGITRALEYAGRIAPFKSKWARLVAEIKDARQVNRRIHDLLLSVAPVHAGRGRVSIDEIWVDAPTTLTLYIFAKHGRAKKVLFPHAPAIFWGKDTSYLDFPEEAVKPIARLKRKFREAITKLLPAGIAPRLTLKNIAFDEAYTFTPESYLARQVIELPSSMLQRALRAAFSYLPHDAQRCYTEVGRPDAHGRRPSILFLPTGSERSGDFETEMAALAHLLNTTIEVRGKGPIIVKPHPRSSELQVNLFFEKLQKQFPHAEFRLIRAWATVPIEVVGSVWDVTCCLGLVTSAIITMNWLFNIQAYCPVNSLYDMYSGDLMWTRELDNFLSFGSKFIIPV